MWSAGCLVEKPWPLESQKPTSKPWPIRLLGLGIVFLRVAARRRLRGFSATRARCITVMCIRLRPRRDAALPSCELLMCSAECSGGTARR